MRVYFKVVTFFVMLTLIQVAAVSQSIFPMDSINKVLTMARIKMVDIQLPADDKFQMFNKVNALSQISHHPYQSLDMTEWIISLPNTLKSDKYQGAIQEIMSVLELRKFQPFKLDESLPNDYTTSKLGVDINQKGDFMGSKIMRQYISALLLAQEYLFKDPIYSDTKEISQIISFVDSLKYLYSEGINTNRSDFCSTRENFETSLQRVLISSGIVDSTNLYSIAISLIESVNKINAFVKSNFDIYKTGLKTSVIETELGLVAVGGFGDDTYNGNFFMIIDLGGNDTYVSDNGISSKDLIVSPARLIVDFSGDDAYIGGDYCFASAVFGVSILMDLGGNDSYSAANHSLSSSLCGFSYLYDAGGNDLYSSRQFSIASSIFGTSLFIDNSGDDIYRSSEFSQGFAFSRSFSLLTDFTGDDTYIAFNQKSGGDDYQPIPIFSQGASSGYPLMAYGGFGVLVDFAGSDNYISGRCSQAFAYANSFAALVDLGGDDKYQADILSHASAGKFSSAILLDKAGSDYYISPENSCGFGFDIGFALFLDAKGNDSYLLKDDSSIQPDPFSISLMLDLEGADNYPSTAKLNESGIHLKYISNKLVNKQKNVPPVPYDLNSNGLYNSIFSNQLLVKPVFPLNEIAESSPEGLSEILCAIPDQDSILKSVSGQIIKGQKINQLVSQKLGTRSGSTLKILRDAALMSKATGTDTISYLLIGDFNKTSYLRKVNSLYLILPLYDSIPHNILKDAAADGLLYKSLMLGKASGMKQNDDIASAFNKGETIFDKSISACYTASNFPVNQLNLLNKMNPEGSVLINSSIHTGLSMRPALSYQELKALINSDLEQGYKVPLLLSFDYASLDKKQIKNMKSMFKSLPSSLRTALYEAAVRNSKLSKNLESLIDIKTSDKKKKS